MTDSKLLRTVALCTTAMFVQAGAYAQALPQPAPPAPPVGMTTGEAAEAAPAQGGLQDIVVTARRQAENVQNVPVAVTVVSAEQIQNRGITSIEKLSVLAPQLIVGRNGSGNGASIGLRGITVNATSISLEQSVATVIDGVYIPGGRLLNLGLYDVDHVEMLKGPQSLFYGKNTTAGAISVKTADPTRDFSAMGKVGYEFNAHQVYGQGYVSVPVSETFGLRVAGGYSKQFGSLIENVAPPGVYLTRNSVTGATTSYVRPAGKSDIPGERSAFGRITAKWDPTDNLTGILKLSYNEYKSNTPHSSAVIANCESGVIQTDRTSPCGKRFRVTQAPLPSEVAAPNPIQNRHNGQTYLDYYAFNATGDFTYSGEKVDVSFVPAFVRQWDYYLGDFDFTNNFQANNANISANRDILEATSGELRARTHLDGGVNLMVGGFYQHAYTYFKSETTLPRSVATGGGGPDNPAASNPEWRFLGISRNGRTKGDTYAVFGQALVDITPELNVTVGVRQTWENKRSQLNEPYVNPEFAALYRVDSLSARQKFTNTSPEGTITYKPSRDVTLFGSYRTGYKSGGFSISGVIARSGTAADATFSPEKVKGFEGGIKSTLLNNQLRLNTTAFNYDYRNVQVDYIDPVTIQYFTQNAAKVRTRGVELDTEFAPRGIEGLALRASIAYTDAKYRSFPLAPCLGGQTPAEGCSTGIPNPTTGAFTRQDLSGQRAPQAPKWTGTAGVDYATEVGGDLKLYWSGNARFSSRYKIYGFAPDSAARFFQPSYAALDATIGLGRADDKWRVQVVGKNLTNKFVITTGYDLTGTGARGGLPTGLHSDTRTSVADPRTVAIELIGRF